MQCHGSYACESKRNVQCQQWCQFCWHWCVTSCTATKYHSAITAARPHSRNHVHHCCAEVRAATMLIAERIKKTKAKEKELSAVGAMSRVVGIVLWAVLMAKIQTSDGEDGRETRQC